MQRYSIVSAAILAFIATSAHPDPEPWMKKEDPSELAVLAMADEECPLSSEALQDIADAVLMEKDIQPVRGYESPWSDSSAKVVMLVRLQCLPEEAPEWAKGMGQVEEPLTQPGENIAVLAIEFGALTYYSREQSTWVRFGWSPAGGLIGKGSGDTLQYLIKPRIEEVIADYHKANFESANAGTENAAESASPESAEEN